MFLQSVGLIPDNMIIISTNRKHSEESVLEKLKNEKYSHADLNSLVKESIDQSDLNIAALKDIYKGFYAEIKRETNVKKEENVIIENIAVIIFSLNLENNQTKK